MSPEPGSENLFSLLWSLYLSLNLSFKYLTISMDQYVQGSWKQAGEDIRMKSVIKLLTLLFLVFSFCSLSLCLSLSVSFFPYQCRIRYNILKEDWIKQTNYYMYTLSPWLISEAVSLSNSNCIRRANSASDVASIVLCGSSRLHISYFTMDLTKLFL